MMHLAKNNNDHKMVSEIISSYTNFLDVYERCIHFSGTFSVKLPLKTLGREGAQILRIRKLAKSGINKS